MIALQATKGGVIGKAVDSESVSDSMEVDQWLTWTMCCYPLSGAE